MSKQLLPIMTANGSFENLRRGGYVYVDKTSYLHSLVRQEGNMFFLSRPRRFGKTLTVSTLEAIFQGRRELFKGLAIDALDYDWKTYPIIHIDFGDCGKSTPEGLDGWLKDQIEEIADLYGVGPLDMTKTSDDLFAKLILLLSKKDKVVVLVDEYDKVLSDNAFSEQVEELRTVLGNFYQVVKTKGALLRFVFITGVTKYARLSVFSKMNNLNDLSLDPDYAAMLGYTQKELEGNFAGYIEQGIQDTGMGREAYLGKVREMYDGYRFAPGCETVYNPVSVGLFFSNGHGKAFKNFWFD
ncbi:MAG: AAA family ATPase, partial [Spirochaetales bacterium]|nr:AAA family ATPase [Spirochaetales bacterium]